MTDMKRTVLALGLVAFAAITAACSSASAQPAVSGPVDPNGPTIVAQNNAFSPSTVEVKAGSAFVLHFENKDAAPHNVAVYKDASASEKVSVGDIISSSMAHQNVPALAAGTYFFRCDVHHEMTGTITVK
jgi:plastocyanin